MTIRRDDLVAAATAGILHHRQIDPLLVYLLQRDVHAQREAMLAQRRPVPLGRLNLWLSCAVGALAVLTASLFAVLFATRAVQLMGIGALAFFTVLYASGAVGLAAWFRMRGFCVRMPVMAALTMASVPLAVIALNHVSG